MTPIKRYTKTADGHKQLTLTLDPMAFIINSIAMGDVIATAAVIKYLTDNYYVTPESFYVVAKQQFRDLFPFVPNGNFRDFDSTEQTLWGIPAGVPLSLLNKKSDGKFVRNTPKAMHLCHYAALAFSDQFFPLEQTPYVPVKKVDVSHFGIDFKKAVVLVTSYRDVTRMWYDKDIIALAEWIKQQGLIPVFIGKTNMDLHLAADKAHLIPKSHLPEDASEYGVDLRNKTTLLELATIIGQAKAICGVDSGPIHLAGTTETPIVCAYPTVSAVHRIPPRAKGKTYTITPRIECANCETRWRTSFHSFEKCFFGHADCCKDFTADRFIAHLKKII